MDSYIRQDRQGFVSVTKEPQYFNDLAIVIV